MHGLHWPDLRAPNRHAALAQLARLMDELLYGRNYMGVAGSDITEENVRIWRSLTQLQVPRDLGSAPPPAPPSCVATLPLPLPSLLRKP